MNLLNSNKRALVIGAGSGGDIVVALLVVQPLIEKNISVDLAGFLTPWALHSFNCKLEKPVNKIVGKKTEKFILIKEKEQLPFFEPQLFKINKNKHLGLKNIYLFSLHYGIKKLGNEIQTLINKNKYDLIIVVDAGGDCLARKNDLKYIVTPIVDFSCLEIIRTLKTEAKKYLAVVSPGVDGELSKEILSDILSEYDKKGLIVAEDIIKKQNKNYLLFSDIAKELQKTGFAAHTAKIIQKYINGKSKNYSEDYIKKLRVNNRVWSAHYEVILDPNLISRIFYIELQFINPKIKIDYNNIMQAFRFFKKLGVGGTEVDLACIPKKIKGGSILSRFFVLNVTHRASISQKKEIYQYVKNNIQKNKQISLII